MICHAPTGRNLELVLDAILKGILKWNQTKYAAQCVIDYPNLKLTTC